MNCGHCKNLNINFTGHTVKSCHVLASTECRNCKQLGHTARYCSERAIPIAPGLEPVSIPSFSWANAAKKAVTEKDIKESESLKQKQITIQQEKKRQEHEAYLERKEKREAIAKEKQERLMRSYGLFCTHMRHEHGPNYLGCIRLSDAPDCFHDLIEKDRHEHDKLEWEMEKQEKKEAKAWEIAQKAKEIEMKYKLQSPQEFKEWKCNNFHDSADKWLDEGFSQRSHDDFRDQIRKKDCKIWLEEQMTLGKIVLGKDGKYRYYA